MLALLQLLLIVVSGSLRGTSPINETLCLSDRSMFVDATGYYRQQMFQKEVLMAVKSSYTRLQAAIKSFNPPTPGNLVTRAVTGYLPGGDAKYLREFRVLLLSVGVMRTFQSELVKTDVVIFTDSQTARGLQSLGCSDNKRRAKSDPEQCIIVVHDSLKSKKQEDPLNDYPNADSIEYLLHLPNPEFYDFVLRGDLDTFITPGFANWMPYIQEGQSGFLFVGRGGYGTREAVARLRSFAHELEIPYNNIHNVGSTWYGATTVIIALSDFSVQLMRYLAINAFTEYERCCNGVDGWPTWHRPVLSMYSGDLAVNALRLDQVRQHGDGFFMDFGCDQIGKLSPHIKHLHCWHTRNRFSKFVFAEGGYEALDLSPHMNMDTPADYATVIAISAARLTDAELKDTLGDIDGLKARKWLRIQPYR